MGGGTARPQAQRFYSRDRDEPSAHATSGLADDFLEELLVRRELAFNLARYAKRVDSLDELSKHRQDPCDPVYTREQFESAATCDDLWNATQKELLLRGIHGYYRMFWGKKIVEWPATPEEALATAGMARKTDLTACLREIDHLERTGKELTT